MRTLISRPIIHKLTRT